MVNTMAKPRKEQVRNLKAEYKFHQSNEVGVYGGVPSQQVDGSDLEDFLEQFTYTKLLGGATEDCPAFIYGNEGPWTVPVSSAFTLQMSDLNNEQPVVVTVQAGDLVRVNGQNVLTVGKLVNRINATVGNSFCASIESGALRLQSSSIGGSLQGSEKYITLSNVTSGILDILGITGDTTITEFGTSGSTRGVVTESSDGLGGFIQLKDASSNSVPTPIGNSLHRSIWTSVFVEPGSSSWNEPDDDPRAPVFGRIRRSRTNTGPSLQIRYFQTTDGFANIDYSGVNPGLLDNTDSIRVRLFAPGISGGQVMDVSVSFDTAPNRTFASLVSEINTKIAGNPGGLDIRGASIIAPNSGPYAFPEDCFFQLRFNGQSTVVNIGVASGTVHSVTSLASAINNAIIAAGQGSQGECIVVANEIVIQSKSMTGNSSSIELSATPSTASMVTGVIGLVPGTYRGFDVAELIGGDIVRIKTPIRNGKIQVTSVGANTGTRGFSFEGNSDWTALPGNSVPVSATPPVSDLFIPEMMEFWEVPNGIESDGVKFNNQRLERRTLPESGWQASATSSLIGPSGRIPSTFLPSSYKVLRTGLIQIQTRDGGYIFPKVLGYTGDATGANNVMEFQPVGSMSSTQVPVRMFVSGNSLIYTVNAKRSAETDAIWAKDAAGLNSYFMEFKNGTLSMGTFGTSNTMWPDSGWSRSFNVDDAMQIAGTTTLGGRDNTLPSDSPRISVPRRDTTTGATPSGNNRWTLLMESPSNGSNASLPLRMYMSTSLSPLSEEANGMMFTVNAKWNQTAGSWSRDVTTERATAWMTGSQAASGGNQVSGTFMYNMNVDTWTSWTKTGEFSNTWDGANSVHRGLLRFGSSPLSVLRPENTIKAWGRTEYLNPGIGIVGYNVTNASVVGSGSYAFDFSNALTGSTRIHNVTLVSNYAPPATIAVGTLTSSSASVLVYNSNTGAAYTSVIAFNSIVLSTG